MTVSYPNVRVKNEAGRLVVRDGFVLCLYLRASHRALASRAAETLEAYRRFVGPDALSMYVDEHGYPARLTESGWTKLMGEVSDESRNTYSLMVGDSASEVSDFWVEYLGRGMDEALLSRWPDAVSYISLWFPSEFVDERGAAAMRSFAVDVWERLPCSHAFAGLSFNYSRGADEADAFSEIKKLCFSHPTLAVHHPASGSFDIDSRVESPSWLNFLSRTILSRLGGISALSLGIHSPEASVEPLAGDGALVMIGARPEAVSKDEELRPYREVSEALKAHLHMSHFPFPEFTREETRRWVGRFLLLQL